MSVQGLPVLGGALAGSFPPGPTPGTYKFWRLYVTDTNNGLFSASRLEMRATENGQNIMVGGTLSASSTNASYPLANLTDGNSGTFWLSSGGEPQWLQYEFPTATVVREIVLANRIDFWGADESPRRLVIQASNDGSSWTTIRGFAFATWVSGTTKTLSAIPVTEAEGPLAWVVKIGSTDNGTSSAAEIALRQTVGGSNVLTGTTEIYANSVNGGYVPSNTLDGNGGTFWATAPGTPHWIAYATPTRVPSIAQIVYTIRNDGYGTAEGPRQLTLQKTEDFITFTDVWSVNTVPQWTVNGETRTFAPGATEIAGTGSAAFTLATSAAGTVVNPPRTGNGTAALSVSANATGTVAFVTITGSGAAVLGLGTTAAGTVVGTTLITATLMQGATTIATRTIQSLTGAFVDYDFVLTAGERALITDYALLEVVLVGEQVGLQISAANVTVDGEPVIGPLGSGNAGIALGTSGTGTVYYNTIVVTLMQGTTTIASWTITNPSTTLSNYDFALTAGELAQITNVSALELVIVGGQPGMQVALAQVTVDGDPVLDQINQGTAHFTLEVFALGTVTGGTAGGNAIITLVAYGTVAALVTGTASVPLAFTTSGAGSVVAGGTSGTLLRLSSNGVGTVSVTGTSTSSKVPLETIGSGSVSAFPPRTGDGAALIAISVSASAVSTTFGAGGAALAIGASGTGTGTITGSGAPTLSVGSTGTGEVFTDSVQITLAQGGVTIRSWTIAAPVASLTDYDFSLSAGELALISDVSALELVLVGGRIGQQISAVEVTVDGSPEVGLLGSGSAAITLGVSASGTVTGAGTGVTGAGAAALTIAATGTAMVLVSGAGSPTVPIYAYGSASYNSFGTALVFLPFQASGTGSAPSTGTGSVGFAIQTAGTGAVGISGAGEAYLEIWPESEGVVTNPDTRIGYAVLPLSLATSASGTVAVQGAGTSTIVVRTTATGTVPTAGTGSAQIVLGASAQGAVTGYATRFGAGTAAILLSSSTAGTISVRGSGSSTIALQVLAFATGSQITTLYPDGTQANAGWTPVNAPTVQGALAVGDADYILAESTGAVTTVTLTDPATPLTLTSALLTIRARV